MKRARLAAALVVTADVGPAAPRNPRNAGSALRPPTSRRTSCSGLCHNVLCHSFWQCAFRCRAAFTAAVCLPVCSISEEAYLAHPKGGITGDHVLIVPVTHQASYAAAPTKMVEQIDAYKAALTKCVALLPCAPRCVRGHRERVSPGLLERQPQFLLVCMTPLRRCCARCCRYFGAKGEVPIIFERAVKVKGAAHTHLQVVGVPVSVAHSVLPCFEEECQKNDMTLKIVRAPVVVL